MFSRFGCGFGLTFSRFFGVWLVESGLHLAGVILLPPWTLCLLSVLSLPIRLLGHLLVIEFRMPAANACKCNRFLKTPPWTLRQSTCHGVIDKSMHIAVGAVAWTSTVNGKQRSQRHCAVGEPFAAFEECSINFPRC